MGSEDGGGIQLVRERNSICSRPLRPARRPSFMSARFRALRRVPPSVPGCSLTPCLSKGRIPIAPCGRVVSLDGSTPCDSFLVPSWRATATRGPPPLDIQSDHWTRLWARRSVVALRVPLRLAEPFFLPVQVARIFVRVQAVLPLPSVHPPLFRSIDPGRTTWAPDPVIATPTLFIGALLQ